MIIINSSKKINEIQQIIKGLIDHTSGEDDFIQTKTSKSIKFIEEPQKKSDRFKLKKKPIFINEVGQI